MDEIAFVRNRRNAFFPLKDEIVFAGGCFDWLHWAHIDFLQRARDLGGRLIVGLNTDESIRRLKGETRPLITYENRRKSLLALRCVDEVVPIAEDTPVSLILQIRPKFIVKGIGYSAETMIEAEAAKTVGASIVILDGPEGVSTTNLLRAASARG